MAAAITVASLGSCGGGGSSVAPSPKVQASDDGPVAVAGDTRAEFLANLAAARAAKKTVRAVIVGTATGSDAYSPYAQVVRTREAIIVRAYRRIQAYPIAGTTLSYPDERSRVDVSSLPQVSMPQVDAAIRNGGHGGSTARVLAQLCGNCSIVLNHRGDAPTSARVWGSKQDSWQLKPDYVFWGPGTEAIASSTRNAKYVNRNCSMYLASCCPANVEYCYPSQGSYSWAFYVPPRGGGGGGGGPQPTPDPDASPVPDLTQPESSACPVGWSLDFTSTMGKPDCEVDNTLDPTVGIALWDLDMFDFISYDDAHYWNRHLACYIGNKFTNFQFDTMVGVDFTAQAIATNNIPPYRQSKEYTGVSPIVDNNGVPTQYSYRVALVNVTTVARFYNVGTAFLTPRRKNCPGT
jgi:hypothetical protein